MSNRRPIKVLSLEIIISAVVRPTVRFRRHSFYCTWCFSMPRDKGLFYSCVRFEYRTYHRLRRFHTVFDCVWNGCLIAGQSKYSSRFRYGQMVRPHSPSRGSASASSSWSSPSRPSPAEPSPSSFSSSWVQILISSHSTRLKPEMNKNFLFRDQQKTDLFGNETEPQFLTTEHFGQVSQHYSWAEIPFLEGSTKLWPFLFQSG